MSVVYQNRLEPEHSGVVVFHFYTPAKEDQPEQIIYRGRLYRRVDAALVYDALRKKYPDFEGLRLWVRVVPDHEVSAADRRAVYAKRITDGPVQTPEGEGLCEEIDAIGARPSVPLPPDPLVGRLSLELTGEGDGEAFGEKVGELLGAFIQGGEGWHEASDVEALFSE